MIHESELIVKLFNGVLKNALERLPKELQADFIISHTDLGSYDAEMIFKLNSKPARFYIECKTIHRKESLKHFQNQHGGTDCLLVCNSLRNFLR